MIDYKNNSYKARMESMPDSEPTAPSEEAKKKSSGARTISEAIISMIIGSKDPNITKSLTSYIFDDLLEPTIKDTAFKALVNIVHAAIYRNLANDVGSGYTNYSKLSSKKDISKDNDASLYRRRPKTSFSYDNLRSLDDVVQQMYKAANENSSKMATVADLYEAQGIEDLPIYPTYYEWGWTKEALDSIDIRRSPWGFTLKMPRPELIEK